jgi:hypothetical protein
MRVWVLILYSIPGSEFIQLRGVLPAHQLAIAQKSIAGNLSKQWLETIYDKLKDYDNFQKTFLHTWWSQSQHSLVKCNIYHGKYDQRSNLTLSGHFLKYATMACLDPRPTDTEIVRLLGITSLYTFNA